MDRFAMLVAVHLFLIKDDRILLSRRFNTGYEDGCYSVVAGHVDGNETVYQAMQREAREEAGITIADNQLAAIQVMHRKCAGHERIDYFFLCSHWSGDIGNNEPDRCDDLSWFNVNELPANIVDYVKSAIHNYRHDIKFSLYGWE
jgi:8-oxo-dGTP diphosphatase